ncbi:unnamed protein product [Rhizophagus irregularis]|nr:unnamed protein product [Rhizophagus irregularis]
MDNNGLNVFEHAFCKIAGRYEQSNYSKSLFTIYSPNTKRILFATHDELTQNCKDLIGKKEKSNKYSQTFLPHQKVTMDARELRSVAMSIILKQRVCRMLPTPSSLHNKQGFQTYPPINRRRRQTYEYKEIDISAFDALFEGKLIEGIPDMIPSPKPTTTFTFNEKRSRYRHIKEREFFINCKKSVSQLILYWETVWLVGKDSAGRCAGWNW